MRLADVNPATMKGPGDLDPGPAWCQGGACPHDHGDPEPEPEDGEHDDDLVELMTRLDRTLREARGEDPPPEAGETLPPSPCCGLPVPTALDPEHGETCDRCLTARTTDAEQT